MSRVLMTVPDKMVTSNVPTSKRCTETFPFIIPDLVLFLIIKRIKIMYFAISASFVIRALVVVKYYAGTLDLQTVSSSK